MSDFYDRIGRLTAKSPSLTIGAFFDDVRKIAYVVVWKHLNRDSFYQDVFATTSAYNSRLQDPLPFSEVKSISKSITKWTWDNYRSGGYAPKDPNKPTKPPSEYEKGKHELVDKSLPFNERQRKKGQIANKYANACSLGGKARSASYDDKREQARQLREQGVNNTQIAKELGVSRATIVSWLKTEKID